MSGRASRRWALVLAGLLGACGPRPQMEPAPSWQRELEALRARHLLDDAGLDAPGRARLAHLLDFEANRPAEASRVDETRTPDAGASRALAWRAWVLRRADWPAAVVRAVEADPRHPAAVALVGLLGRVAEARTAAVDAAIERLAAGAPARLHPEAALRLGLYALRAALVADDGEALAALRSRLGLPPLWTRGDVIDEAPGRALAMAPSFGAADTLPSGTGAVELGWIPPAGGGVALRVACRSVGWRGVGFIRTDANVALRVDGAEAGRLDRYRGDGGDLLAVDLALSAGWHRFELMAAASTPGRQVALALLHPEGTPACVEWAAELPEGVGAAPSTAVRRPTAAARLAALALDPTACPPLAPETPAPTIEIGGAPAPGGRARAGRAAVVQTPPRIDPAPAAGFASAASGGYVGGGPDGVLDRQPVARDARPLGERRAHPSRPACARTRSTVCEKGALGASTSSAARTSVRAEAGARAPSDPVRAWCPGEPERRLTAGPAHRMAWLAAVTAGDATMALQVATDWADRFPRHADAHAALGLTLLVDHALPPTLRAARARTALGRALQLRADHVPALLAAAATARVVEHAGDAAARIERAEAAAPDDAWVALVGVDVALDEGDEAAAERRLERAAAAGAPVGLRRVRWLEAIGRLTGRADAIAAAEVDAGGPRAAGRAAGCRAHGDLRCALAALEQALERTPERVELHARRLEVALDLWPPGDAGGAASPQAAPGQRARGRTEVPNPVDARVSGADEAASPTDLDAAVARAADSLRRRAPHSVAELHRHAGWLLARGRTDAARTAWRDLLARGALGHPVPGRMLARLDGVDLEAWAPDDVDALLKAWGAWQPPVDLADAFARGDRVELLDRWVAVVHPDGGVDHITHRVTLVRSRRAADDVGELELPPDARLLELRTLRADGTVVESEGDHGKGETSFSQLGVGDVVDYRYRAYDPPALGDTGTALSFIFRIPDAPVFRSELVLLVPDGLDVELRPQNGAPSARVERHAGYSVHRFTAETLPPLAAEPLSVPLGEITPRVLVRFRAGPETLARRALARLESDARPGARVRRWVADARRAAGSEQALAEVLFRRLRREVVAGEAGDLGGRVEATLAGRRGNRAVALRALYRAAGLDVDLLLAHRRDASAERDPGAANAFTHPVVRVRFQDGPRYFDPSPEHATLAWDDPALHGARALAIETAPASVVELPEGEQAAPAWRADLALSFEPETGALRGTLRLSGRGVGEARLLLERLVRARRHGAIEQLLGPALPGVTVADAVWHDEGPDGEFSLEADLSVPTAPGVDGARRLPGLLVQPVAARLGEPSLTAYAALARRETPLLVGHRHARLGVRITVPAGWQIRDAWASVEVEGSAGRVAQTVRRTAETVELEREVMLRITRISPRDYPAFARWAARVARALGATLVVAPEDAGGSDGEDL